MNKLQMELFKNCQDCKGLGFINKIKCPSCKSTGWTGGEIALFLYEINMELVLGEKYSKEKKEK